MLLIGLNVPLMLATVLNWIDTASLSQSFTTVKEEASRLASMALVVSIMSMSPLWRAATRVDSSPMILKVTASRWGSPFCQ